MVKSRNQIILDLTASLTENFVYKDPSQREAWRSIPSFWNYYSVWFFSREYLENIFLREKRRTDSNLISQLGNPYLRSSNLLACWNHLGGYGLKRGMVLSHGWVERGSSQLIRLNYREVISICEFVNVG